MGKIKDGNSVQKLPSGDEAQSTVDYLFAPLCLGALLNLLHSRGICLLKGQSLRGRTEALTAPIRERLFIGERKFSHGLARLEETVA